MDSKKVVITGGSGFLGRYVVEYLAAAKAFTHITIVDLKPADRPVESTSDVTIEYVSGVDVCDLDSLCTQFASAHTVIHLAGIVSFSLKDKDLLMRVNVEGTKNVLAAVEKNGVGRLIHISSVAALGFSDDADVLVDEAFSFDWGIAEKYRKYYMLSKHLADVEVEKAVANGLNAVVCYPGLMLGPGDLINSAKWIASVKAGKIPFNMPGGTNVIDVRDVARAIAKIAQDEHVCGDFLLSGANLPLKEMNDIIAAGVNVKGPKITLPRCLRGLMFRIFLAAESICSKKLQLTADNVESAFRIRYFTNDKAKRVLGWTPEIDLAQTVKDTVDWMVEDGQLTG